MWLRTIGAFLVVAFLPPAASAQTPTFRASLIGSVEDGPTGVVLGDFDGDGLLEVATSHSDTGRILISYLFQDPTELSLIGTTSAGNVPSGLVTDRFDEDEALDFVVTNVTEGTIHFIKGFGDFTFADPGPPICVGTLEMPEGRPPECVSLSPVAVAAADLDGDGPVDVVVANQGASDDSTGEVVVLKGQGDGNFERITILTTEVGTLAVAIGRVDADQRLDIVAVNSGADSVSTFFGRGGLAFDVGPNLATGAVPVGIALGDLNGDGAFDIVTADSNADSTSVLLSNGNRTFRPRVPYHVGTNPSAAATADVDGDGHVDVLITNKRSSDVSVLYGDGSGQLPHLRHFVLDEEPIALALGNFDNDAANRVDIVTVNAVPKTIAALFNLGETFDAVEDLLAGNQPRALAAGDIDNDGFPDLVAVTHLDGEVLAFRASATGFAPGEKIADLEAGLDLALTDLDGDGWLDLAVLDDQNHSVAVIRGLGGGRFGGVVQTLIAGDQPTAMTTADVNDDGHLDLIVVSIGPPGQVAVFRGQANGMFAARQTTQVPCTLPEECTSPVPVAVAAADLNCDGADDLLVANSLSWTVAVMVSDRQGRFTIRDQLPETVVGRGPNALTIADFNRDSQPDFAVGVSRVTQGGEAARVLFGNRTPCDATFRASGDAAQRFGDNQISSLVSRDFAGDALVDVVGAYDVLNGIQVFPALRVNEQMLTVFASRQLANVSRMPLSLAAADFNGDGAYDAATANGDLNASNLSVLTNALPSTVVRGDGNGDGAVSAADITTLIVEISDGDGKQVEDIQMRPPQTQRGVDANGDGRVDPQDVRGNAAWIFRRS